MSKKTSKKTALPKYAEARLRPHIESGIEKGLWSDDSVIVDMFKSFAKNPTNKEQISALGGMKSELAQSFVTDAILIDLSSILRQKRYTAHIETWEVEHRTVGLSKGNPRPACFIIGQTVIEDTDGSVMESALFNLSLWDNDVALADDLESGGTYSASVSCRNLDNEILDLSALSGITEFKAEEYDHMDKAELLRSLYDTTPISDLDDDLSRSPNDFRMIEATVSYSGVQTSRAGNAYGRMMLKDDSTMTIEAIESGEDLLLKALCSPEIASRFGKYSRILALVHTKDNGEYGLSANIKVAIGLITIAPPQAEQTEAKKNDDDDAADYFKVADVPVIGDDDDDDDEESTEETTEDVESNTSDSEDDDWEEESEEESEEEPTTEEADDDDDWEDW